MALAFDLSGMGVKRRADGGKSVLVVDGGAVERTVVVDLSAGVRPCLVRVIVVGVVFGSVAVRWKWGRVGGGAGEDATKRCRERQYRDRAAWRRLVLSAGNCFRAGRRARPDWETASSRPGGWNARQ